MLERRFATGLTTESGRLVGHAAVFNSRSKDLGGLTEIIEPGAFTRTLRENPDVRALINHDSSKVLGRTTAGTLKLEEDQRGLRVEITPPDTSAANDLLESVRRGDVDGFSFGFSVSPTGQRFDYDGPTRYLRDVDLLEVSIVTFPAYPDASVALRALDAARPPDLYRLQLALAEV